MSTMILVTFYLVFSEVPPSVYVDQEEMTANAGETITIQCTANGTPRAKITWYKTKSLLVGELLSAARDIWLSMLWS